jgi:hypothetical protein
MDELTKETSYEKRGAKQGDFVSSNDPQNIK